MLEILKLCCLSINSLLKIADVQRSLCLNLVLGMPSFIKILHVLVQVLIVEPLDLLDRVIPDIQLFSELLQLDVFGLDHIVTTLTFLEQLDDSAAEAIEILKHNEALDV